jgi:hypothetical protein
MINKSISITVHVAAAPDRADYYSRVIRVPGGSPGHCLGFDYGKPPILFVHDFGLKIRPNLCAVVKFISPTEKIAPGTCFTSQRGAAALMGLKPRCVRRLAENNAPIPSTSLGDERSVGRRVIGYALADLVPWLHANMSQFRPIDLVAVNLAPLLQARLT